MKKIIRKNRALTIYIIIALIAAIAGVATAPGNELVYMLLAQYILLPFAGLICSACSVKKGGATGFVSPIIYVAVASLLPILIFGKTDIVFFIFSAVPCTLGYLLGLAGYLISQKRKTSADEKKEAKEEKIKAIDDAHEEVEEFSVEDEDINASDANAPEAEEIEEAEEIPEKKEKNKKKLNWKGRKKATDSEDDDEDDEEEEDENNFDAVTDDEDDDDEDDDYSSEE